MVVDQGADDDESIMIRMMMMDGIEVLEIYGLCRNLVLVIHP